MGLLLGGLAATGVVAAHLIAYLVAVPDPHHRELVLEATGHGNWSIVSAVALGALVVGLLRFAVRDLGGEGHDAAARTPPFWAISLRLASLQVGGFVVLEMLERIGARESIVGLVSQPAILIGVILQIAIACLGASLLILFARVVGAVLGRQREPSRGDATTRPLPVSRDGAPRLAVGTGGGTLRGPPFFLI